MSNNHSQKFYCYSCNKETLGIISDVQTSRGINQCIICTVGSKEYNDYYYPKFDEKGMHR